MKIKAEAEGAVELAMDWLAQLHEDRFADPHDGAEARPPGAAPEPAPAAAAPRPAVSALPPAVTALPPAVTALPPPGTGLVRPYAYAAPLSTVTGTAPAITATVRDETTGGTQIPERSPIGDELRIPIAWCEMGSCISHHADPDALGEADNRARAIAAGWRMDGLRRLACPKCQQSDPWFWTAQPVALWDRDRAVTMTALMAAAARADTILAGPARANAGVIPLVRPAGSPSPARGRHRTRRDDPERTPGYADRPGYPDAPGQWSAFARLWQGPFQGPSWFSPDNGQRGSDVVAAIKPRDRNGTGPATMAAQAGRLVGGTGCHWLTPVAEMAALATGSWPVSPDSSPMRWACFPGISTRPPLVDASRVSAARDFTITTLRRWEVAGRCEDIVIVVSELLTNALRHALPRSGAPRTGPPVRLGLLQPGPCVVCAVADPSRTAPVPRRPDDISETGRGLQVIAALSDQWGYTPPSDMGKVLWALFSTRSVPRPGCPR
jgi:hypothetical protein